MGLHSLPTQIVAGADANVSAARAIDPVVSPIVLVAGSNGSTYLAVVLDVIALSQRNSQVTTGEKRTGGAMTDPVTAITAGAIAQLAFNEFIKSSAGEAAKKLTGEALAKANELRQLIWAKLRGSDRAETALAEVEKEGTPAALDKVTKLLDVEMALEPEFANQVRQVAQQIINIQNQNTTTLSQQNINYGRDQNVINQPQGDIRIGGS